MSVPKTSHLLVFGETSGTSLTNYGTFSDTWSLGGSGTSPTHWEWHPNADPQLSYFESKVETGGNMPSFTTPATGPTNQLETINCALKFRLDSAGAGSRFLVRTGTGLQIYATDTTGDFTLTVIYRDNFSQLQQQDFTLLAYGVDHVLSTCIAVTGASSSSGSQARHKLNSNSVISPSTFQLDGNFGINWPSILRGGITTDEGVTGRIYWCAYQRGGSAWTSSDLDAINANPSTAIIGWPGGGPNIAAISAYYNRLRASR